jgi:putative membrane protein
MMKLKTLLFGCVLATAFVACDKDEDEEVNEQDRTFVRMASISNRAEIELGNLALSKAADASVRNFAQMMVTDHTTAQAQLRQTIDDIDMQNASINDSLGTTHVALRQRLMGLSGRGFDSVYMNSQVMMHMQSIALFQAEANGGASTSLRNYANSKLPNLQTHYNMADSIARRVGR